MVTVNFVLSHVIKQDFGFMNIPNKFISFIKTSPSFLELRNKIGINIKPLTLNLCPTSVKLSINGCKYEHLINVRNSATQSSLFGNPPV